MSTYYFRFFAVLLFAIVLLTAVSCSRVGNSIETVAAETKDNPADTPPIVSATPIKIAKGEQTAVFAGGCFWGVEAVFEHIKGVSDVTSGYSGGTKQTADYETVSGGETKHAEAVKVVYHPSQVSYEQLLKVFFAVAHDPTQLNRQTPDTGTQYRSAIFYSNDEQKRAAENYIAEMTKAKTFAKPIVTQVVPLDAFYKAEDYHQDYLAQHPTQPYIVAYDQPKVENLQKQFPDLYVSNKNSAAADKIISADDAAKKALNVGAKMPAFSLKDANGKTIESDDLLKQGNLVVVFYRGSWCPFCNLYLRNLQKNMTQIKAAGGNLVAISVENPDNSLSVAKKNELDFTVLSDPNLTIAKQFGIVYDFPKETGELYKSKGLDIAKHNEMEKAQLPLSATYIVNKKGEIVYAFLEPDYKQRAAPEVIIETLSKIKSGEVKK